MQDLAGVVRTTIEYGIDILKECEMNKWSLIFKSALAGGMLMASGSALAVYNSGSTGADGAFNPTTSQAIQLPPDGVFNYTNVNIPAGVIITYIKNTANTPVTILVSGDATIDGTIDVSATPPLNPADMSGAGLAGPGGYNGGRGGQPGGAVANWVNGYAGINVGRAGVGPGGGSPGAVHLPSAFPSLTYYLPGGSPDVSAGGGGAYGTAPAAAGGSCPTTPGVTYGNISLIPLVGGSGGGGGVGGPVMPGSGGGGGGGAILISASGAISVTGSILANGGTPVSTGINASKGVYGGGGSGGAIRLIATTVSGNGVISALGGISLGEFWVNSTYGSYMSCTSSANGSQNGGAGRIRIETENLARTVATTPAWSGGAPSLVFVPGMPTLSIDSVGGIVVPAQPTGNGDVALPTTFTNPVTVTFLTSGVTVGSSIKLTVIPAQGTAYSVTSAPTTGTTSSATASVAVSLLAGPNTLQASVTYTVIASIGDAMSVYAQGERVEKITLASTLGSHESTVTLITLSGKEYVVPSSVLAAIPS